MALNEFAEGDQKSGEEVTSEEATPRLEFGGETAQIATPLSGWRKVFSRGEQVGLLKGVKIRGGRSGQKTVANPKFHKDAPFGIC